MTRIVQVLLVVALVVMLALVVYYGIAIVGASVR